MSIPELAVALVVTLNFIASIRAVVDPLSTLHQKLLQLLFVWLIPIAGALLTLFVLRHTSPRRSSALKRFVPASIAAAAFGAYGTPASDRLEVGAEDWTDGNGSGGGADGGGGGGDG
jgi:hypothetical protein